MKVLVIAPHADDEVIGCGGRIANITAAGGDVTLLVMSMGGIKHRHVGTPVTFETRHSEMLRSCAVLGISSARVLFPDCEMNLESVPMLDLVTAIDSELTVEAYEEVYIPEPSHNLDHRRTHEAALAAFRQVGPSEVRLIAQYEGTSVGWASSAEVGGAIYTDISKRFDHKVEALASYASQLRDYPHPTSQEGVLRLAQMRGLESGFRFAERFRLLRMTLC